jgi:hypothetical protein
MTTIPHGEPLAGSPEAWSAVGLLSRLRGLAVPLARNAAVLIFFALATALIFRTSIAHLNSALIGPPEDNMNDFWDTWYTVVGHDPAHFFSTKLLRFPEGTSLLYQSFAWPQLFAVVVLSRFFGTDLHTLVALQNATLLASFPLAGLGAFCLVHHLTRNTIASLIGGFIFAFNPSHVAHALHHAGVSSIEFLPFFVLCYLLALERRSYAWLAGAAIFNALSALSCWYYFFYGAYFLAFQLLYERIRDGAWPRGWHPAAAVKCLAITTVLLAPLVVPMLLASVSSVNQAGGNIFVADLLGFVAFPPEHWLAPFSQALYTRFTGYPWEATVYLGLVNIAILAWYWRCTHFTREPLNLYVALGMLMFALLAAGELLHVAGVTTFLPLPDAVLDRLPFFANVRSPSRAIVFVYLFLAIGIGMATAALLSSRRVASKIAVAGLALLMIVDFYPARLAASPVTCPAGLKVLDADPERGFGVLNMPFAYADADTYMFEQICHRRPMVDGVISREMGKSLLYRVSVRNLPLQRRQLVEAHVKYLLLHKPRNGLYRWNRELAPMAQYRRFYAVAYDGPDMLILRTY